MKRLFITGGTGFFGKSMPDYRLHHPEWEWAGSEWVILSRSPEQFKSRFPKLANQNGVSFVSGDVRSFAFPEGRFDAIIHAAIMCMRLLSKVGVHEIAFAGFDGFPEEEGGDFYFNRILQAELSVDLKRAINRDVSDMLRDFTSCNKGRVHLRFVTSSRYASYAKSIL